MEIRNKKGSETDHLFCLEAEKGIEDPKEIEEFFLYEQLLTVGVYLPWYVDFINFLACKVLPPDLNSQQRKKFLHDVIYYQWDDLLLFRRRVDQIVRRCVLELEAEAILTQCHSSPYGGHFGASRTTHKVLRSRFYWPTLFKDCFVFVKKCY